MKKFLLLLAGVALFATSAMAQRYEKNIFGVRAGLNVANMSVNGVSPDSKIGFHVAGSYERLLTSSMPLYLETGLQLTWKGCQIDDDHFTNKVNAAYLEIPIMVNYKFNIKNKVTLYPSLGFYYGLGIGGKIKTGDPKVDTFGKYTCKRSDFGMRMAATALWKQFTFGLGYEFGFTDINKGFSDDNWAPEIKTGNFFISVGYNF